jgi:hypothetical protein
MRIGFESIEIGGHFVPFSAALDSSTISFSALDSSGISPVPAEVISPSGLIVLSRYQLHLQPFDSRWVTITPKKQEK